MGTQQHIIMAAGAAAGIMEHCVMYPVDVVRTRMQSIRPQENHLSFIKTVTQLIKKDRLKAFRGMSVVITGAGPAHALYFSTYENIKSTCLKSHDGGIINSANKNRNAEVKDNSNNTNNPDINNESNYKRALVYGLAGCGATLVHDAVMNPVDVIKQRMQMLNSPFRSSLICARHIFKTEGIKAFYRSYFTQLAMNLPYQSLHFVTYELMQDLTNRQRDYNPKAHMISGAVAGAIASAVTTPLDVCKTLLNTQEKLALVAVKSDRVSGLANALKVIYKCCGLRGFFQGLEARVVVAMPSTAISWVVYEFFKYTYKCDIEEF